MSVQSSHSALSRSVVRAKEVAMSQTVSTSITRRSVARRAGAGAAPVTVLAAADNAHARDKQTVPEKSLYERLGASSPSAVVDHFSDAVVKNPIVGQKSKNPQPREWHPRTWRRLPGLKFMRTLWVCNVREDPSSSRATNPASRPRPRGGPPGPANPPSESTRSQRDSDGPWHSSRSRSARRRSPDCLRRPQKRGNRWLCR